MSQYVVTTPKNLAFSGKTCGVIFRAGRAFVSEHTIDASLGLSAEQIVEKMKVDFGYTVEQVGNTDRSDDNLIEVVAPSTPASKKRIGANATAALGAAAEGG
jgi:hypothetical protein